MAYRFDTDFGATDFIVTSARWNNMVSAVQAAGGGRVIFPGATWTFNNVNLPLPSNIIIEGDGMNVTKFVLGSGVNTSVSDNWFISIGSSYITFRDFKITSGSKRLASVFQFNSMGSSASTECQGINFEKVWIDKSYAKGISGGNTTGIANGETHHITDLNVRNCWIFNLGNPAQPYNFSSSTPDVDKCHAIAYNQTTWGGEICGNWIKDCSGDAFNSNLTGWADSNGMVNDTRIGGTNIHDNLFENCLSLVVNFGNWGYGFRLTNNKLYNPTCNTGFCQSIEGINMVVCGNINKAYQCRAALEVYGANVQHDDITNSYLGEHPIAATRRTDTASSTTTTLMLTGGFQNSYGGSMRYDDSLGVSSNLPSRKSGIHISNKSQPGYQPQTWDGRNYAYGFTIATKIYQCTGPEILMEQISVSEVLLRCFVQSKVKNESVVSILNTNNAPGVCVDGMYIDLRGSSAPTKASNGIPNYGLFQVNNYGSVKQGTADSRSIVKNFTFIGSSAWQGLDTQQISYRTGSQIMQNNFPASN